MSTERLELKVQALLEKISNLSAQYENQLADFRVEITMLSRERDSLAQAASDSQSKDVEPHVAEAQEES